MSDKQIQEIKKMPRAIDFSRLQRRSINFQRIAWSFVEKFGEDQLPRVSVAHFFNKRWNIVDIDRRFDSTSQSKVKYYWRKFF